MHRKRYQTGKRSYLLWETDETGRDVADVIAISSAAPPSSGHRGIAEWKLGACKLTRASVAGGVGLTSASRAHLHGVIMHGHAAGNEYQVWGTIKAKRHLWELHYRGEMLDVLTNQSHTSLCHRQGEAASTRVDSQSKLNCLWWWTGAWRILGLLGSSCLAHKTTLLLQSTWWWILQLLFVC